MNLRIRTVLVAVSITATMLVAADALPASASTFGAAAVTAVNQVISNITAWISGILGGLATLLLMIGGLRYLLANGDPGEVMKAKETLKYAAIGYSIAILAPVLLTILKGFVG